MSFLTGAPGGSRTHDLWLRKPTLYPAELRAQLTSALYQTIACHALLPWVSPFTFS